MLVGRSVCGMLVLLFNLMASGFAARFIELFVTCDKECFDALDSRTDLGTQSPADFLIAVVRDSDRRFSDIGVHVVLVGLEIWNMENQIQLVDPTDMYEMHTKYGLYRRDVQTPKTWSDASVIFSGCNFQGGSEPNGMYIEGTVCQDKDNVGIVKCTYQSLETLSATLTHELGHGIGMPHDAGSYNCPLGLENCVEYPNINSVQISNSKFSDMSVNAYEAFATSPQGGCLDNKPTVAFTISTTSSCGNGVVDAGEQCDCGQSCLDNCCDCCDSTTCQFKSGSTCAEGACCDTAQCQFKSSGTVCRAANHATCDVQETCSGSSATCPADVTTADGTACTDGTGQDSYCVGGVCQSHNAQCAAAFSSEMVYYDECYSITKTKASSSANCGYTTSGQYTIYTKCTDTSTKYYKCGLLQCKTDNAVTVGQHDRQSVINPNVNTTNCVNGISIAYETAPVVPGEIAVADGTKCDTDKACYNMDCIDKTQAFNDMALESPPVASGECGNGVVDGSEQCDCAPYQCDCCDQHTCQFKAAGTACLSQECKQCDGQSSSCPATNMPDLTACADSAGNCYAGECLTMDSNCVKYFGAGARPADDDFYLKSTYYTPSGSFNGGGYYLYNTVTATWSWYFINANADGKCGMLMCHAYNYASVPGETVNTYTNAEDSSVWLGYVQTPSVVKSGQTHLRQEPLLVDRYSPCLIPDGGSGTRGYCDLEVITVESWDFYTKATCKPIP